VSSQFSQPATVTKIRPIIVGVAGGTGSGKTTVVSEIVKGLDSCDILVIQHDSYYRDRSQLRDEERAAVNYDHPDALETSLLIQHLKQLLSGETIEIPIYDFASHTRRLNSQVTAPCKVIVVEGILILAIPELRCMFDIKVFVDTDADIRFIRRMERDIAERSRTRESVVKQYIESVRPMHLEFVEPSKRYADIVVPEGGFNSVAVDMLLTKIRSVIEQ
jgi:uridine kinase